MMRTVAAGLAMGVAACLSQQAGAQARVQPGSASEVVSAVGACRSISDAAQRLACFDAAAARLSEAVSQNGVVLLDREEIRRTRRSLFGFQLPRLSLFGGGAGETDDDADEISATVASARSLGYDKWQLRLEDGAIWQTTEGSAYISAPHAGSRVVIRRGPMGSYMMRIDGQRAVRAMRTGS